MKNNMRRILKIRFKSVLIFVVCALISFGWNSNCDAETDTDEVVYDDGDLVEVKRKEYGLIARDVAEVKVGSEPDFWEVYIRHKKENKVREVRLTKRICKRKRNYKTYIVANNVKDFFPKTYGSILVDKKNRVLFTGITSCYYFVNHNSSKQCDKAFHREHPYLNKVVEKNVTKTWGDNNMFAYVKNNKLHITGEIISYLTGKDECYQCDTVQTFFEGQGNNIKQVICGENYVTGCNIFVLMKDGSVWGIGRNNRKLISPSEQKKYSEFVKIIDSGVKQIAASTDNVAIVKEDNSLWVWGRIFKSKKKIYSATPQKVANNVEEVALSEVRQGESWPLCSILAFLKENHKAYGIGYNQGYAFTERYKKGWHSKPVLLMKNVKHVYVTYGSTLMLNQKNELYWSGEQGWYSGYYWIREK